MDLRKRWRMRSAVSVFLYMCVGCVPILPSTFAETPMLVECPIPNRTPHLNTNVGEPSQVNAIASFWCESGYNLVGPATSSCSIKGEWDPPTPFCKAGSSEVSYNKTCEFPLRNPYVLHNVTEFPVLPGTVVGYKCDFGFILVGVTARLCTAEGKWTGKDPFCAAKVSADRRVSSLSNNVDFTLNPPMRGAAILDDNNYRCSIADAADRVPESFWTIDLLEKQSIDVVVLIFKDYINTTVNLLTSLSENDPNPTRIKEDDYSLGKWTGRVVLGGDVITTYEYRLNSTGHLRYLTIQIPKNDLSKIMLCEVMLLSKQASSYGQCWNTRDIMRAGNTMTVANGTCFSIIQSRHNTWEKGNMVCSSISNGTMATHLTVDQQRLLASHLVTVDTMRADRFWIGGHANLDSKGKKTWLWEDDTPIKEFFWGLGQPSMQNEFKPCIALSKNLMWDWDDQACDSHYNFICTNDILSCGQPDVPANTFLNAEFSTHSDSIISAIGTKINYTCPNSDYELIGHPERICKNGGKWSGKAPYCWKKGEPKRPEPPAKQKDKKGGLSVGALVAIIAGIIIGLILIIAIILYVVCRKKRGGVSMKYTTKTESAETLDVDDKKGSGGAKTNYAATDERK